MNQILNVDDTSKTPTNEDKPKTSFLPSNYYYEKDYYSNDTNLVSFMPSQYYNFQQPIENSNNEKTKEPKVFLKPTNNSKTQQNPYNITNNISISNYSFSENQKKEINYEPQFNIEQQNNLKNEEIKKKKFKNKKMKNFCSQNNNFYECEFENKGKPF